MRKLMLTISVMALPLAACSQEEVTSAEPTEPVIDEPQVVESLVEEPVIEDPAMTPDMDPTASANDEPDAKPIVPEDEVVAE